jgi:hypothetical protein
MNACYASVNMINKPQISQLNIDGISPCRLSELSFERGQQ